MKSKKRDIQRSNWERGSSFIEFALCAPVLLLIAGCALDLSRYIRYLQVTSFVSQEAANLMYRECSDLTVFQPPKRDNPKLIVDQTKTEAAITACIDKVTGNAQKALDASLTRSLIVGGIVRYDVAGEDPRDDKGVRKCSAKSKLLPAVAGGASEPQTIPEIKTELKHQKKEEWERNKRKIIASESNPSDQIDDNSHFWKSNITLDVDAGLKIEDPKSKKGLVISRDEICKRGNVVAVEVSYAFVPIVKFIPALNYLKKEDEGIHKETTIL